MSNIHIIEIPEEEKVTGAEKKNLKDTPNLMKNTNLQIQEDQ